MTWPHLNVPFALSTKRRRSSSSISLVSCPARCQHRTRRPEHHRCQPPLPPPSPHHHRNTTTTHHRATLGTIPRANKPLPARSQLRTVYPARLPPTSFVASQTPARYAEPRCSHTLRRHNTKESDRASKSKLSGIPLLAKYSRAALL